MYDYIINFELFKQKFEIKILQCVNSDDAAKELLKIIDKNIIIENIIAVKNPLIQELKNIVNGR